MQGISLRRPRAAALVASVLAVGAVAALTLVATTLVWIGAQARAHMKAKILYVEPDSSKAEKPENKGHSS